MFIDTRALLLGKMGVGPICQWESLATLLGVNGSVTAWGNAGGYPSAQYEMTKSGELCGKVELALDVNRIYKLNTLYCSPCLRQTDKI